jgi:hypothetical protein
MSSSKSDAAASRFVNLHFTIYDFGKTERSSTNKDAAVQKYAS